MKSRQRSKSTAQTPRPTIFSAIGKKAALVLVASVLVAILGIIAFVPAGATLALSAGEKCFDFYFLYTDGHIDQADDLCMQGMNVDKTIYPPLHVNVLHVSCSDTFQGGVSDGASDLAGHVISDWWIIRDRNEDGKADMDDGVMCGPGGPTPTPSNTPTKTPTNTPTKTPTPTRTPISTNTPTQTNTPVSTNTPTNTPTDDVGILTLDLIQRRSSRLLPGHTI